MGKHENNRAVVPNGLDSTCLARYHFSRSICHRLDLQLPKSLDPTYSSSQFHHASSEEDLKNSPVRAQISHKTSPIRAKYFLRTSPLRATYSHKTSPIHEMPEDDPPSPSPAAVIPIRRYASGPISFQHLEKGTAPLSPGYGVRPISPAPSLRAKLTVSPPRPYNGKLEGKKKDLKRLISWSRYLEPSGDEEAVEEAEDWMIDMKELFLGLKFAQGTHSRLYEGIYHGLPVAVKIMRIPDDNKELAGKLDRQFTHEVSLLSRLQHPNIVKFIGACKKPPVCCILTEYMQEGSLRAYLHKDGEEAMPLSMNMVVKIALDIARGMDYMHSQGIVHRDLKSDNLVLGDDVAIKITDFGVARLESQCEALDLGTYRWMAPEMISKKPHNRKVDVYSFGILLWEIMTRMLPFEQMTGVQVAFAVVHKHARPEVPPNCPAVLRQLMQHCWSSNPDKRPDFWQVVKILEKFETALRQDFSFTVWQSPSERSHPFLRCFTGCNT